MELTKDVLKAEAIAFAEWLRTFESLEKKNGFWILESQISSEELYKAYLANPLTDNKEGK